MSRYLIHNDYLTRPSRLPPMFITFYSMGIIKRRIFVHGEQYNISYLLDELWQYDIYLKIWVNINRENNMPSRSRSSKIVVVDKLLYLIWCENIPFSDLQISIYYFDSEKNTCEFLTNLQGIHASNNYSLEYVQSIFHYNNALYLIAVSQNDTSSNIILKFSLIENYWSVIDQKGNIPKIMMGVSGSIFDNKYFCFGDMVKLTKNIYHEVHIFDLKTYTWSHEATYAAFDQYPSDRIFASLSFNETHGFLSGGKSESPELLDDLWSIDLQTLKWHKFNFKLEYKLMRHKSVVYDESTLFIFGKNIDNVRSYQMQKYVIEPPPLYKICLYVLMKCNIEESELKSLPLNLRKDIIPPQIEFLVSDENHLINEVISHSDNINQDE